MMLRSLGTLVVVASVLYTGCRCDKERGAATSQASASASAANVRAPTARQDEPPAEEDSVGQLLLPRPELGKEPPPAKPPADAERAPLGVFYRQLTNGKERAPRATDRLLADLKVWDETGKLLTDTSTRPKPLMFAQQTLPAPLRLKLAEQPIGSVYQLWLPPEATAGWKLLEWPAEGLVRMELHIIGAAAPRGRVRTAEGRPPGAPKFKPPPSTGPPANAKQGPDGLRYIWLESGPEGSQPDAASRVTLMLTGYDVEGVVVSEIVHDQRTEMDLAKAPKGVAYVVGKMVRGDTVRAWLEPALAEDLFPQAKSEVVVDVTLVAVN